MVVLPPLLNLYFSDGNLLGTLCQSVRSTLLQKGSERITICSSFVFVFMLHGYSNQKFRLISMKTLLQLSDKI